MVGPWIHALFGAEDELGDFITALVFQNTTTQVGQYHMKYDPTTDKLINLNSAAAGSGTPKSATLMATGVAYQVPAGKKLVCIIAVTGNSGTNTLGKIRSSATVDTADGTVLHDQTAAVNNSGKKTTPILTVLANQFLTSEQVSGAGFVIDDIIAFETDA